MIIVEQLGDYERRYSDLGYKIRQIETDILYDDAVDVILKNGKIGYTYEETNVPISDAPLEPQQALDIIFGGINNDIV